jgi:hypothetical protein
MQGTLPQVMQFDNTLKSGSQLCDCVSQGCLLFGSCISRLWIWHRVAQADRDAFHCNDGSSIPAALWRYSWACAAARSLPCSISSTGSEGAIHVLEMTL